MFGGTSSWGQNNQQQQQQQQPPQQQGGLFGGGGGFGQPASTGGFGQPAQSTGGLFGGGASAGSTGFGGFGANAQQQQQQQQPQSNAFGAARPAFGATGGSTFGQPASSAGGGLFGSTNNTASTFGANTATTGGGMFGAKPASSGFGSGATSSLFGAKPATSGFGTAPGVQQTLKGPSELQSYQPNAPPPPPPSTGTANPAYYPTWQADPSTNTTIGKEGPPHLFHSITAMLPYQGTSWEELRAMDYQQNRKEATPQQQNAFGTASGGFGQPAATGFGQPQPAATGFGAKPAGTGLFGAAAPAAGSFGQTSTGTGFGASNTTGGGLFGAQPQQNTGGGLFGQTNTNTNTGGGLFGQSQPQQNTGGGLFGSTNSTPFGATQNQQQQPQQNTSTFGGFGQAKPAGFGTPPTTGFGATTSGTNMFGQSAPASGGFGGFGQTQPQPQQQQQQQQQTPATGGGLFGGGFGANNTSQQNTGGGLFGQTGQQQQPASTGFGAAKPGGLFGSTSTPAATGTPSFGGFGQTAGQQPATGGGLFGSTNTNTGATGGGLFGQTQPQQNAQPATGGGLFGSTPAAPAAGGGLFGAKPATSTPGTGLFGAAQPAQPAQASGGLFGNTGTASTGGGLFGSMNNSQAGQQGQQSGGLFGAAKPAGGLFGGGAAGASSTGGGLFGQQPQSQQAQPQAGTTGGLFGNLGQSQPVSSGLFGSTAPQPQQQSTLGGGLFGGLGQSQAQQPQQQQSSLTASIDQNPYGNNPLFAYNGQKLEVGSQNKKPALPPLTASAYRLTPSTSKSKINRLRGFASPLNVSQGPARPASPLSISSSGKSSLFSSPVAPDRYKNLSDTALTPNAFVPRPNIKKLSATPKLGGSMGGGDQLESVLGKSALRSSTSSLNGTPTQTAPALPLVFNSPATSVSRSETVGSPMTHSSTGNGGVAGSERAPKKGDYWCRPKLERLKVMPKHELAELRGFTAGRKGYGEVAFLEPVDLTQAPLDDLLGAIIVVDQSELSVYPDDYPEKPTMGHGLNVPARIMLENVFTSDKATKEWVRDPQDPRFQKFMKRVKAIPNTEFISYTDDGTWTFRVEHFTTYGVADSDEDEDLDGGRHVREQKKAVHQDLLGSESGSGSEYDDEDEDMLPPTRSIRDLEAQHDSGLEEDQSLTGESVLDGEEDEGTELEGDESVELELAPLKNWELPFENRLGAEGMKNVKEMQKSFFGTAAPVRKPGKEMAASKKREVERGYGSFFERAEEEIEKLDKRAVKRTSFGETQASLPKLRQPRKYVKVPAEKSVVKGSEGVRVDAGLALGRSFRCSWGPNGELVHLGKICSSKASITPETESIVHIEKVHILTDEQKVENNKANRLLALLLETTLVEQVDGVPTATIHPNIRFHDFVSRFDVGDRSHEANLFRLGVALFDEIDLCLPEDSPEELVHQVASIRRKLALSNWLEDAVSSSVDTDLLAVGQDKPGKVFTFLSGHQVQRAVESALEGGDMRLATLVSQAGGQESFKNELLKQLEDWDTHKVNPLVAVGYRKLYALLAGITDISHGNPVRNSDACPDVLISQGLDWKRAFGLHMWYGIPFENSISDVVQSYTLSLSSSYPPAKPLPPYLEKPDDSTRSWNLPTEPTDVMYNILQLYSDTTVSLDQVLRSRDTSASPFDVRLAWHLYLLLSKVLQRRDFEDRDEESGYSACADRLTEGYAAQLESTGEWMWAAFVLLHLETADGRGRALRQLLLRHPDVTAEEQKFLVEKLHIPAEWIHASRAASLCSSGDAWEEFHTLIDAKLYDRAHRVLDDKLAPEALVRDDQALVIRLKSKLSGQVESL